MGLLFVSSQWLSDSQYVPLFASLASEDAGAIVAQLKASKTPYRIGGTGEQILVPADKVAELRLRMAVQGLPLGGGVGFEVFDKTSFGRQRFQPARELPARAAGRAGADHRPAARCLARPRSPRHAAALAVQRARARSPPRPSSSRWRRAAGSRPKKCAGSSTSSRPASRGSVRSASPSSTRRAACSPPARMAPPPPACRPAASRSRRRWRKDSSGGCRACSTRPSAPDRP